MNVMRLKCVLGLTIAGVLALSGCSGDNGTETDAGPRDTGVADTGVGPEDTGVAEDAGTPDSGRMDASGPPPTCRANSLGCRCTPGGEANPQGSCEDETHVCILWTDPNDTMVEQTATCQKPCDAEANGDTECLAELVGGRETRPANICRGGFCAERVVNEGEDCILGAIRGERLSACEEGVLCITGINDTPYIGSCGRRCETSADCTGAGRSICNPNQLNAAPNGICSSALNGPGAFCRPNDITGQCDGTTTVTFQGTTGPVTIGALRCYDIFIDDVQNLGQCFALCNTTAAGDTQCAANRANNPDLEVSCQGGLFTNPMIGLCNDACSAFPDDCGQANQTCNPPVRFQGAPNVDFGWCFSINEPQKAEFDGMTADNCATNDRDRFSCPKSTFCLGIQAGVGVCARGCDATATSTLTPSTDCDLSPVNPVTCLEFNPDNAPGLGVCFPPDE